MITWGALKVGPDRFALFQIDGTAVLEPLPEAEKTSEANVADRSPSGVGCENLASPEIATSVTLSSGGGSEEPGTSTGARAETGEGKEP
jgi:hypothetical protein